MEPQDKKIGDELYGFKLIEIDKLDEYDGVGFLYKHEATSMEVYHVQNNDKELFFSYIFETIPNDNTGVAHIIEHSVLSGSKKYPIRDPFIQLQKSSACTFLNAMTFPTKTLYPAASPLEKDFDNIFDVYSDAVFAPLLREETFMQEGIRLNCDENGNFAYKGVVFNEMLGDKNDGEYVANNSCMRNLFSDTAYNYSSGGEPLDIVDLDYTKFKSFYMQYYHPTNSKLFFYGNLNIEKYLKKLNIEYLSDYNKINVSKDDLTPKKWNTPRNMSINCPMGESDSGAIVATSFVTTDSSVPLEVITISFIYELLLGSTGCPLYKAIIDSKLGDDVSNISGISTDYSFMPLTIAISNVKTENIDKVEKFILKQLSLIVENGFSKDLITATFKRLSFQIHEKISSYPMGFVVLKRAMRGWLRGLSPISTIEYTKAVNELELKLKDNPRYLEEWIDINIVNNSHRLFFVANPDSNAMDTYNEKLAKKIKLRTSSLNESEKNKLIEKSKKFMEFHNSGDSIENLNKIPKLLVKDLPKEIKEYNHHKEILNNIPLWIMKEKTNDIAYFDIFIHLEDLNEREIELLPLYTRILENCRVKDMDNTKVMTVIMNKTGGFNINLEAGTKSNLERCLGIILRVKMLNEDIDNAINLTKDIILESKVDDYNTIWNSIVDLKNTYKSIASSSGYRFSTIAASSNFSDNAKLIENLLGISQWVFIDSLNREDVSKLAVELNNLKNKLKVLNRYELHLTCEENLIDRSKKALNNFLKSLEKQDDLNLLKKEKTVHFEKVESKKGFILPSSVNHTSYVIPSFPLGSKKNAIQRILAAIMSGNDLWNEVRVIGGAYGVDCHVESLEQLLIFISASDPNLAQTFETYRNVLKQYSETLVNEELIDDAIINNVANDLKPHQNNRTSIIDFRRILYNIDNEMLKKVRESILETTSKDIQEAAVELLKNTNFAISFFCDQSTFNKEKETLEMEEKDVIKLPI